MKEIFRQNTAKIIHQKKKSVLWADMSDYHSPGPLPTTLILYSLSLINTKKVSARKVSAQK